MVVLRIACMPSLALILLIRLSLLPLIMRLGVVVPPPPPQLFLRCSPCVRRRSDPVVYRSPCKSPLEFWATKASLAAAAMLVERRADVWGEFVVGTTSARCRGVGAGAYGSPHQFGRLPLAARAVVASLLESDCAYRNRRIMVKQLGSDMMVRQRLRDRCAGREGGGRLRHVGGKARGRRKAMLSNMKQLAVGAASMLGRRGCAPREAARRCRRGWFPGR